jgi:hypothetical protein
VRLSDAPRQLDAIHFGHVYVGQQKIDFTPAFFTDFQSLLTGSCR